MITLTRAAILDKTGGNAYGKSRPLNIDQAAFETDRDSESAKVGPADVD